MYRISARRLRTDRLEPIHCLKGLRPGLNHHYSVAEPTRRMGRQSYISTTCCPSTKVSHLEGKGQGKGRVKQSEGSEKSEKRGRMGRYIWRWLHFIAAVPCFSLATNAVIDTMLPASLLSRLNLSYSEFDNSNCSRSVGHKVFS